ncbi:MAG TPA: glycosyltransferase family 4 protein [Planctomycetota bacterium]|nr:glycosyltransferase family 4 protein [Planctomycetota bacterium]
MVAHGKPLGVAFLAPRPPPVMGPTIATEIVLSGPVPGDIRLYHIDTSDRRAIETLGRIDAGNVWNAVHTAARLFWTIVTRWPRLVYVPITQTRLGYLRDSVYLLLAWLLRRRVVFHLRGGDFAEFAGRSGPLMRRWLRWTLRRVDGVIVLGDCLKGMFSPFVPPERIHVVPNGEDFPEFDGPPRDYRSRRAFHVAYLGNLMPVKGAGDLLQAIPAVLARHPGTRFTLAGEWCDAPFRDWATGFVRERGLGERVRFPGLVDRARKAETLRDADLFVFPSTREGHPWVIVEALAAGLPIVSCDAGCIRESVLDGRNGRIVPMRDPEALADAINELLADPDRLGAMAAESRRHYLSRFTRNDFRRALFDAMRGAGCA